MSLTNEMTDVAAGVENACQSAATCIPWTSTSTLRVTPTEPFDS
jgi:hypothetical protein